MKKLILEIFLIFSIFSFAKEEYVTGKIIKKVGSYSENSIKTEIKPDLEEIKDVEVFYIKIQNKIHRIEFPIYTVDAFNLTLKKGDKVVLCREDENSNYYITDVDRRDDYILMGAIFSLLTLALAKKKGAKSLIALLITVWLIFYFFIPCTMKGYSPILISVITALLSSIITILFVAGFTHKGVVAIIGSVGGTIFSGVLSYLLINKMNFSGYPTLDSITYIDMLQGIKIKELVPAGIILGSMGAIMDVSMSISSALTEIREKNPSLGSKDIYNSGLNIGKDMVGTMINTLILAYIGSSLFDMIVINKNLESLPFIRLLNYEFIGVEILKSFAGSIGILISIPLTAYFGAHLHRRYRDLKNLKSKFFK